MDLSMILRTAWRSLMVNKMRSILTALGIIIGVASMIMMVALSQGATAGITERIASMGTNILTIMPSGGRGAFRGTGSTSLKMSDATAIAQLPYVKNVAPSVETSVTSTAGSLSWSTSVTGTTPELAEIRSWELTQGSFFTEEELDNASKVAVIGPTVVENLFSTSNSVVGQKISLNGLPFTVIGVLPTQGSSGGMSDDDNVVYVPITTAQIRLTGSSSLRSIVVQATEQDALTFLTDSITTLLRQRHRLADSADDDFRIMDSAELLSTIEETTQILTLLLGGIACVSLIVGGIGVMNIMLVSVTERTREIGIRMAVGATTKDVLSQFLVEAVMLCIIGGAVGSVLGWAGSTIFGALSSWTMKVPPWSVGLSIGFSLVVGVVFGYYPARRAAEADPIEALRYE
ncbi:MAG: ABC transporter permease [Chitinophagales bacterium]